ncbi:MAG TPA: discoidin domain-containing protein [Casimicrobiaceae bacterium]|nr:discoidin domain-containing protein [Casimicrobiaceae bacterium]
MRRGLRRQVRARVTACLLALSGAASSAPLGAADGGRILDRFETIAPWQVAVSDGVRASIGAAPGPAGPALRLDFDLGGTAGYAAVRRTLPVDLPPNFEISFDLRADAPMNDFQFKLADASGENVWWFRRPDFAFPLAWRHIRIRKRQIDFAWGPASDRTLRRAASIEFVVSAGRGGGSGSLYIANLALRELPIEAGGVPPATASASSSLPGSGPERALDGDRQTAWRSDPARGKAQSFTIDFGRLREFGGLLLRWQADAFAAQYDVLLSRDGERWRTVKSVLDGSGGPDAMALPDSEARFVRLMLRSGPGAGYALAEVEVEDLAFGASPNAFVTALARDLPRGTYPRGFSGEQPYWTVVGIDGGHASGLLSEDGALEVHAGGFSIEPFVVSSGQVSTWADVEHAHSLADGYLPMPRATWQDPRWRLTVDAFAEGTPERSSLVARYRLANRTSAPLELTLALAVRPFQVNPPAQFLNTAGGVSPIRDIAWDGEALLVDGTTSVNPLPLPDRVGAFSFGAGPVPVILAHDWPERHTAYDRDGFASAVLAYRFTLAPGATATVGLTVPLSGAALAVSSGGASPEQRLDARARVVAAGWHEKLDRVRLRVPESARNLADTLRTALADLLVSRDGPVLRPGTRAYSRSWIRDGTMISEALLRMAHPDVAADYLRWYAPHQFASGKLPCCIDMRGADPVPENDAPGEFVFLAAEIDRYGSDPALLEALWPHVAAAMRYLEALRQSGRVAANLAPENRAFYGLLPASISHEGYAAKPEHSYWDDFWALKGYDAACSIAQALGREEDAARYALELDEFRHDLAASLQAAMVNHAIEYLPGSAELGDFDPTSTSIAFAPRGDVQDLPPETVRATYERYWRDFLARRDGRVAWDDYAPYELRNVSTFVRLGWRDRVAPLLDFFLDGRRPAGWNQWAEVVGRDPRKPRFVGDMPHAWVASDYIRAVLDMFVYERAADSALVLAAGVPAAWLDGDGVAIEGVRTPYGPVSYALVQRDARVVLDLAAGPRLPPGGFVLSWPYGRAPGKTRINGRPVRWQNGELTIAELPARIVVER